MEVSQTSCPSIGMEGDLGDVSWTEAFANLLTVCYRTYGDLGPTKVAFDKLVAQVQNAAAGEWRPRLYAYAIW